MPDHAARTPRFFGRRTSGERRFGVMRACALILLLALVAGAGQARDRNQVHAFRKLHPCPATGQVAGACPGWVVDHLWPLCAGGEDAPGNMQWQTVADAKLKDREERRLCARLRGCKR